VSTSVSSFRMKPLAARPIEARRARLPAGALGLLGPLGPLGALGALGLLAPAAALAADLPSRVTPPPPPPVVFSAQPAATWSGLYVGAQAGWLKLRTANPELDGFAFGGRIGADQQSGRWVYGAFLEGERTLIDGAVANYAVKTPWRAGLNARLGYALDSGALIYALAGGSWLDFDVRTSGANPPTRAFGYGVGLGAEIALQGPWTAFVESRYMRHMRDHEGAINGAEARIGLNYRFGGPGGVVARN